MVQEITITPPETFVVGETVQLAAICTPEDAIEKGVVWSIQNGSGRASITENGLLTAKASGSVTVFATAIDGGGASGSAEIIISEIPKSSAFLTVSSGRVVCGQQIVVNVDISEGSNLSLLQFTLSYDDESLQLESVESGNIQTNFGATINANEAGKIRFAWDGTGKLTAGGTIMSLTFTALGNKAGTLLEIIRDMSTETESFICKTLQNGDYQNVDCVICSGVITIMEAQSGDLNSDGRVNVLDANLTRRAAVRLITLTDSQFETADVNGDGFVNVLDANLIRRYAVKLLDHLAVN